MPPRRRLLSLLAPLFITAAHPVLADVNGTWTPFAPPERRYDAAAAYDPGSDELVVFGGWLAGVSGNDTWTHGFSVSSAWELKPQAGPFPPARTGATMIYDSQRARMVLFGGSGSNDVWVSGPSGWTQLAPTGTLPPVRAYHVAIYDPSGDRMIIFGGSNSQTPELNDVWELTFSGTPQWNELHTVGAPARKRAGAVLDPVGSRMIIFGGSVGSTTFNDVWAMPLAAPYKWKVLSISGTPPSAREGHTAVWDPIGNRMIAFGGGTSIVPLNDVWALNFSGAPQWTQLSPPGTPPSPRIYHSAVWDSARNRMIVFGGYFNLRPYHGRDIWILDLVGAGWSQLPDMPVPDKIARKASLFDPVRRRLVTFGGFWNNTISNELWVRSSSPDSGWIQIPSNGAWPSARIGATLVYDPSRDRAVLFGGGPSGQSTLNDVWFLDLSSNQWTQVFASGTPPDPRYWHSAVYDPVGDRMLVFGGGHLVGAGIVTYNDLWELVFTDPPAWNQITPSGTPPPWRVGHSAVLDPTRNRMIVFGGGRGPVDAGTFYNDVWELSLSGAPTWTQLTPQGVPPYNRMAHSAFFDIYRDRMVIYGGGYAPELAPSTIQFFEDIWELRFSGGPTWNELHPGGLQPTARQQQSFGYDAAGDALMIFGGYYIEYQDDTWMLNFGGGTTGIEPPDQSVALRLVASPNPVLTRTSLQFHLANRAPVILSVHDVQGRRVAVLVDRMLDAGDHAFSWDPKNQSLGSGVYFYDLIAGRTRASGRLVLLK